MRRRRIGMGESGNFLDAKISESKEMAAEGKEIAALAVLAPSPLFRSGLVALLSTMGFGAIEEAADLAELAGRMRDAQRPGVLLISLPQSEDDLAALIQEIKAWAPKGKVVFIAPAFDMQALTASFAAGAAGYIVESISREALQHSLGLVRAGEKIFPSELADALSAAAAKPNATRDTIEELRNLRFTDQEIEILRCVAQGRSNSFIGRKLGISEAEVSANLKHLLRTLRLSNRTQAALWGVAHGFAHSHSAPQNGSKVQRGNGS